MTSPEPHARQEVTETKRGSVKSSSEIQRFMTSYAEKSRNYLHDKFQKILDNSDNSYFRDLALSGLGLKNSPQCTSQSREDEKSCRENLIDGLTTLAQKQTLSPLMPTASLSRMASLSDTAYIMQNETYQSVVKELTNQAQTDLSDPVAEKKIKEKIFPQIKSLMIERINELQVPDEQKKFMVGKIKSVQFAGSNCTELGQNDGGSSVGNSGEVVSSLLVPNAFYDTARNTFKFCSGYLLQSTSEFQIAMTIGHELSHSIDPCQIASGPTDMGFKYKNSDDLEKMEQEFPLKNVITCLRDPSSVEAKNLTMEKPVQGGIGGYKKHPIPDGSSYPVYPSPGVQFGMVGQPVRQKPTFCNGDQVTESFSDWMGAEVLPRYIQKNYNLTPEQYREGYANVHRVICWSYPDTSDNFNYQVHPAIGKRINKIMLVNPKIRTQMGCPEKHSENVYCDSDNPLGSHNAAPKVTPTIKTKSTRGAL
jgi:hypothetical protein